MLIIPPTIGRRVLLFVGDSFAGHISDSKTPFEGGIAYVHSSRPAAPGREPGDSPAPGVSLINIGYTDHNGVAHNLTSVPLFDRAQAEGDQHRSESGVFAVWMQYQFEQALARSVPTFAQRPGDVQLVKTHDNGVPVNTTPETEQQAAARIAAEEMLPQQDVPQQDMPQGDGAPVVEKATEQ